MRSEANPGDLWFFRWLDNRSYSDRATAFSVMLPTVPPRPANQFDVQRHRAWLMAQRRFEATRAQAAAAIHALKPARCRETDVWGFFAKSAEIVAAAPANSTCWVIVATDLGDTLNRQMNFDLAGAHVVIAFFQGGPDPFEASRRRAAWAQNLTSHGAARVVFLDPSQSLVQSLFSG
jgi:hypothetical protein